ncbi:hypothetical protein PAXRUDRAFT_828023 [Paxillus rubicundulus Ve08.2h10]|uniref:Unplaced genomic scaffold scaffold_287, whole genome shotgun sequence n=1 Tax=Paxillus rubicundulus Ve08.2h10 TaxID=930991 RepID=A0A0D0DQ80_9AGAM|nr:hypothetical protein PAXRUDRAFT_828023 [Paxillus rubicundulus Ve08.2h10]
MERFTNQGYRRFIHEIDIAAQECRPGAGTRGVPTISCRDVALDTTKCMSIIC